MISLLFIICLSVLEGHNEVSPKPSLFYAEQTHLTLPVFIGEVLQSPAHSRGPPLDPLQKLHIFPMLGPETWMEYSFWDLSRAEKRGTIIPLLCWPFLFLMEPRISLAFWAASPLCRLMSSFSSTRTPTFFSAGLLSRSSFTSW